MSKPEDIPQDVWNAAQAINLVLPYPHVQADIARAIMAEREACAEVAANFYDGNPFPTIMGAIATKIRKRGEG